MHAILTASRPASAIRAEIKTASIDPPATSRPLRNVSFHLDGMDPASDPAGARIHRLIHPNPPPHLLCFFKITTSVGTTRTHNQRRGFYISQQPGEEMVARMKEPANRETQDYLVARRWKRLRLSDSGLVFILYRAIVGVGF
jgi:hypothetical protein